MSAPASTSACASSCWRGVGQARALLAPVQVHDERVRVRACGLDRGDQPGLVGALGGRDAALRVGRGPAGDERVVDHVARADDRDALPLDLAGPGRVGLGRVRTDPNDADGRARLRRERVRQPFGAVVDAVVVRHGHDVDAGRLQRGERGRRSTEVVLLRLGGTPLGDRGLEVHHRDVGGLELGRDRAEHPGGVRIELRPQAAFEVDVASEREGDGLSAPAPTARGRRRGGRRGRRGSSAGSGGRRLVGATAVEHFGERDRGADDDHDRQEGEGDPAHRRSA